MSGKLQPIFTGYAPSGYLARMRVGSAPVGIAFSMYKALKRKSFVNFSRKDNRL